MTDTNLSIVKEDSIKKFWLSFTTWFEAELEILQYDRDYLLGLTEAEKQEYEEVTGRKFGEKRVSGFGRVNNFLAYPKATRMCKSLFPNNYLDVAELRTWNDWLLLIKIFFLY